MFRSIPVSNKICFDKDIKRSWRIHEDKLKKLKSSLSKDKPQEFYFLNSNPKRLALEDARKIEVDRQNKALLGKINQIAKGRQTAYLRASTPDLRRKTLNQPFRKREMLKIMDENQQILRRIHCKKSAYDTKRMFNQRKAVEKNINLISEFQYKDYPITHTPVNLWVKDTHNLEGNHPLSNSRSSMTFTATRAISGKPYSIVCYVSKGSFFVEVEAIDASDKHRIELPEAKARQLIQTSFGGSLNALAASLELDKESGSFFLKYRNSGQSAHPQNQ